jgi:hypothetical protein
MAGVGKDRAPKMRLGIDQLAGETSFTLEERDVVFEQTLRPSEFLS